ncbi:MAG: Hsp20 family protein, partial [Bacteroidota bacterium]|nr:Hsp20 family protein [Bacteroidota bacterium]
MFDDFFNNDLTSFFGRDMSDFFNRNQNMVMPAVNIKESQDNFQIELAAPGLRKEDFQLHLENNILTVSAQKETRNTYGSGNQNQAIEQGS